MAAGAWVFAVGNDRLISALTRVKSYLDYGAFTPIQVAAAAALNDPDLEQHIDEVRQTYKRRRDVEVESFGRAGWGDPAARRSMFALGALCRKSFRHLGSLEFAKLLIEKADVAVAPGRGLRRAWRRYVRLALVENEHSIRQAAPQHQEVPRHADETLLMWWRSNPRLNDQDKTE